MQKRITTPFTAEMAKELRAGDSILITGTIYVARDAAHKKLCELLEKGEPLPADVNNGIVYYAGPTPPKPGQAIGAVGPTSSYRMDAYAPTLLAKGLRGMIGKGLRSQPVVDAIKAHDGVYFGAVGGAGALLAQRVKKAEIVAYPELGAEALRRMEVEDFPVVVIIDHLGNNLYESGQREYLEQFGK